MHKHFILASLASALFAPAEGAGSLPSMTEPTQQSEPPIDEALAAMVQKDVDTAAKLHAKDAQIAALTAKLTALKSDTVKEVAPKDGVIKTNSKTAGHAEWLRSRGYTVDQQEGQIYVHGSGFVETIDLSGPDGGIAAMKAVVKAKQLFSYGTKFVFKTEEGTKTLFGFPALPRLGKASALVVSPVKVPQEGEQAPKPANPFDAAL